MNHNIIVRACPICSSHTYSPERILNSIQLVKCQECNFVFANLPKAEIEKVNSTLFDDGLADVTYETYQTTLDGLWFQEIAARFTQKIGTGKVLDVGCGNGTLLQHFRRQGWECYGVDSSAWTQKYAEQYGFVFMQGHLEELSLESNSFDLIVSTSTLEHISQPVEHIREVLRLIKPGGTGYFAGIPNYQSISIVLGCSRFYYNTPPMHVNFFTPATMRTLFQAAQIPLGNLRVTTYGIPETHEIYNILTRMIRRFNNRRHQPLFVRKTHNIRMTSPGIKRMSEKFLTWLILLWYYPGRLFSVGDELEVVFVKDAEK